MRTRYLVFFDIFFFISMVIAFIRDTRLGFYALTGYILFLIFAFNVLREKEVPLFKKNNDEKENF